MNASVNLDTCIVRRAAVAVRRRNNQKLTYV